MLNESCKINSKEKSFDFSPIFILITDFFVVSIHFEKDSFRFSFISFSF